MPTGLHAHPHRDPLFPEITVELLRLLWVFESSFLQLSSFCIHIRNLLEARVIITAYNQHVRLLSPGLGADIVMESLHSLTLRMETYPVTLSPQLWARPPRHTQGPGARCSSRCD